MYESHEQFEPTVAGAAWQYRWLVLFLAIGFAGLAWLFGSSSESWTAAASIAVEDPRISNLFTVGYDATPERYVTSQAEIIRSRTVAARAVEIAASANPVAAAAMCANDQGQFDEFHYRMFEIQGNPAAYTPEGLGQIASDLGLDQAAFDSCVENAVYDNVVQENIREASLAGVNATPTFFVNGKKLGGNYPLTTFQEEIASALGAANER